MKDVLNDLFQKQNKKKIYETWLMFVVLNELQNELFYEKWKHMKKMNTQMNDDY